MTSRTVSVALRAEVAGYVAGLKQASTATRAVAGELNKLSTTQKQAMTDLGRSAMIGGAAVVGGLGLATKAAINWETAWAGVTKTVNGSAAQMEFLEEQLRSLATTLPATHEEIAGVAEAAGQLGIARPDIAAFTKTMIDLGETTNLSADEAATAIAQMTNVMRTAPEDVDRLGSTLVALGNAGASTEREIILMSQRIAGAASVVGLSEGEVLAFANAVASMGIDVEAGGSSVSRVLTDMSKAAQSGGAELDVFAKTAGMSAQQFSTAFQEAPAQAFASFINGLAGVQEAGGNVFAILDQIGLSDVRVSQAILGMASSGDLLTQSLDLQSRAWQENSALTDEANKRYETAASRIAVARNEINEAAIEIGGALLPALAGSAESVGGLASSFAGLPGPVKSSATGLAAVSGSALLAAGAFGTMAPKVAATREALQGMGQAGQFADRQLGRLGKVAGVAAAITVVGTAVNFLGQELSELEEGPALQIDAYTRALLKFADTGRVSGEAARGLGQDLGQLAEDIDVVTGLDARIGGMAADTSFGLMGRNVEAADQRIRALDDSLTSLVDQGYADEARRIFDAVADGLPADKVADFRHELDGYRAALANSKTQADLAADSTGELGGALDAAAPAAEDLATAMEAYAEALADTAAIDAYTSTAELTKAFRDLKGEMKDGGQVTNDEKIALGGFARQVRQTAEAVFAQTGSQQKANESMRGGRARFIELAEAAGYTARKARKLADDLLGIPARTDVSIRADGLDAALQDIIELRRQAGIPISVTVNTINRVRGAGLASGGQVRGAGTSTSDSIPAWLSTGEYVVRAAAVNRYGSGFFDAANAMRLAGGGPVRRTARTTAADVRAVVKGTGDGANVADIEAAIDAVQRLTDAYAEQRQLKDMTAGERRRYHAEQAVAADEERLARRLGLAEEREERKETRAANKAAWEFDRLSADRQLKNLDKRIAAERKFSDEWIDLQSQRSQILDAQAEDARRAQEEIEQAAHKRVQDALEAIATARRVRDEYARTVSASLTGSGGIGAARAGVVDDAEVARLTAAVKQAQMFGTTAQVVAARDQLQAAEKGAPLTGGSIARTRQARLAQAKQFVADLRALRAGGLNGVDLREILSMGPDGGAAYARALVEGGIASVADMNTAQAEMATLARDFGNEAAGWFHQAGVDTAQGLYDGMLSTDPAAKAAASRLAGWVTDALRSEFEIASPSKRLAREVGRHLPSGVMDGMKAGEPALRAYLGQMVSMPTRYANVATSSASPGMAGGSPQFHYTLHAAPSVPTETQLMQMTAQSLSLLNI